MLRHPVWGAICLLAVLLVLCTDKLCTDARPSAYALLVDDDDEDDGDGSGSSSFSFSSPHETPDELAFGFYDGTCPSAEAIVASTVRELFAADANVAAALVRLFFHDCFVHVSTNRTPCSADQDISSACTRALTYAHGKTLCSVFFSSLDAPLQGCDASVLLDRIGGGKSERDAAPNRSLRGFGAVDKIKARLEKQCPGTVSCADILALAARDSLVLVGGPTYPVLTGRRDSAGSFYDDVNIPAPNATYAMTLSAFARRGFTERETVALLGAHSIGKVQCRFFRDRIYNFAGTGEPDDSLDADMVGEMRAVCSGDGAAPMEMGYYRQGREVGFGAHYYAKLLAGRGILRSDQQLTAGSTVRWVRAYAAGHRGEEAFREDFAHAMVKLSALAPLKGSAGQVRVSCSKSVE
ncbi:peroxidase A2 [Aegilops tauschii subsp. strangulata]|nr:putative Peroxidase 48 [Aegilops tauschii subsp. strangulata]XP_044357378.1 putative Peroxidase 48 isoform X1 [Triticum aestivum]